MNLRTDPKGTWNNVTLGGSGVVFGYILEIERTAAQLNLAITTQPAPVTVPLVGGTASFSVAATGLAPLTYQWRKDGVPGHPQSQKRRPSPDREVHRRGG